MKHCNKSFQPQKKVRNSESEINFIDLDEMIDEAPMKTLIKKGGSKNTLQKINEKI